MKENSLQQVSTRRGTTTTRILDSNQVAMIEEALESLGDFGEVRLVIEKGKFRFLVTQKSFDTQKWYPGAIASNE